MSIVARLGGIVGTGAVISAQENAPMPSISCCFHGVAPTR